MERLRGTRDEQWTSESNTQSKSDPSIRRNPAGYRLLSASSREPAEATGAQMLDINPIQMQANQQKVPLVAQQCLVTPRGHHAVHPTDMINQCVNVDCA